MPIATQFCMGIVSHWSCTCGDLSGDYLEIKNAGEEQCEVFMPRAYRITLPDNWYCNVAGISAKNLSCLTADNQHIFIQSVISDLPIQEADQAIQKLQEGEGIFINPVVDPEEEKITREVKTIGGKRVLSLLSEMDDIFVVRYFMKNNETLYVFIVRSLDPAEIENLTPLLEDSLNSMHFLP